MAQACSQPKLLMQQILPKTAKIYSKTTSFMNFEIPPKIEILVFLKNKKSSIIYRRGTKACICHLDFQYKFFYMRFLLSKTSLYMWLSAHLLVEIDIFLKVPCLLWAWNFVSMYITHSGIRLWRLIANLLENVVFLGLQNTEVPLGHMEKNICLQLWMLWFCKWSRMSV